MCASFFCFSVMDSCCALSWTPNELFEDLSHIFLVAEPTQGEDLRLNHPFLLGMVKLSPGVLGNPVLKGKAEINAWVAFTLDRAVMEIIQPCVERSVMIACTTTRYLPHVHLGRGFPCMEQCRSAGSNVAICGLLSLVGSGLECRGFFKRGSR